ncbi:hypothetical protein ABZW47_04530 [Streptomyces sp. NPDC004549]|uniref:aromatic-ring hydroxylase C-terminal domain-containing protein n=1 Tax=Streptomyces sp. NPDC004549 TaxID=3154283 RepID=UPI0033ABF1D0
MSGVTQRAALPGDHPLTGRYSPDLHLSDGSRLTDHAHEGGFLLLDRSPDGAFAGVAAGWADRVRRVTDADTTPAPTPTPFGVLVRPDGVIAWASDTANTAELTSLEAALLRWAGEPGTPCAP